jgi:hypothetical protein
MTQRQFFEFSIDKLEKLFDDKRHDVDVLTSLIAELSHRKTPRARSLQKRVLQALSVQSPKALPTTKESPDGSSNMQLLTVEEHRRIAADLRKSQPDWTAEEQRMALAFATLHERLADFIESRSAQNHDGSLFPNSGNPLSH